MAKKPQRETSEGDLALDSESSAMNGSAISQLMAKNQSKVQERPIEVDDVDMEFSEE